MARVVDIDSVHGGVRHSCDQCDYKTNWKGSLKRHIDAVHGDVRYSCDQCDYKAKFKVNLKIHEQTLFMEMCSTFVITVITKQH